jgi:hypothetical protein
MDGLKKIYKATASDQKNGWVLRYKDLAAISVSTVARDYASMETVEAVILAMIDLGYMCVDEEVKRGRLQK